MIIHKQSILSLIFPLLVAIQLFGMEQTKEKQETPRESHEITVVFDLGGVLVKTDTAATLQSLGIVDLARLMLQTGQNPKELKTKMYEVFERIQPTTNPSEARDPDGDLMPSLMCDWMTGKKSCQQLRSIVANALKSRESRRWFSCPAQQRLVARLARTIFNPVAFAKTRKLIPAGVAFAQACKKRDYRLAILSNWDPESFVHLRKRYANFFALFDEQDIFLSGDLGLMKPNPQIYQHVAEKLGADNQLNLCLFIDDQKENIKAAAPIFTAVRVKDKQGLFSSGPDFDAVRKICSHTIKQHRAQQAYQTV